MIVSDLVKWDTSASPRCAPVLGESKKETLGFSVCLDLFKIRDTPDFVKKERHVLVLHVSDDASKGRRALLGTRLLLVMKAGVSPFPYKDRRALSRYVSISYTSYNARTLAAPEHVMFLSFLSLFRCTYNTLCYENVNRLN
jgi:hypothetical protein